MNINNFKREHVRDHRRIVDDGSYIEVQRHESGVCCTVDSHMTNGYFHVGFESGFNVSMELNDSKFKLSTEDSVVERDLSSHPSWNGNRDLLIKVWVRSALRSSKATHDETTAIVDLFKILRERQ